MNVSLGKGEPLSVFCDVGTTVKGGMHVGRLGDLSLTGCFACVCVRCVGLGKQEHGIIVTSWLGMAYAQPTIIAQMPACVFNKSGGGWVWVEIGQSGRFCSGWCSVMA